MEQKDLDIQDAWLLKEGHCLRSQALQLCQYKKVNENKHLFFEAGSLETLINMVKSSQGFTVLPYLACQAMSAQDQKHLRNFKGQAPARDISFVTGPYSMKSSIDKAMVGQILKNIPAELRKNNKVEVIDVTP